MLAAGIHHSAVFINGAYAIRRARSLQHALTFLLRGEADHGDDPIFHLNLACYHCQLGDLDTAKPLIQKAIHLHPTIRGMVFDEPDLAPLWDSLGGRTLEE